MNVSLLTDDQCRRIASIFAFELEEDGKNIWMGYNAIDQGDDAIFAQMRAIADESISRIRVDTPEFEVDPFKPISTMDV